MPTILRLPSFFDDTNRAFNSFGLINDCGALSIIFCRRFFALHSRERRCRTLANLHECEPRSPTPIRPDDIEAEYSADDQMALVSMDGRYVDWTSRLIHASEPEHTPVEEISLEFLTHKPEEVTCSSHSELTDHPPLFVTHHNLPIFIELGTTKRPLTAGVQVITKHHRLFASHIL
jgi:hypothetical protein